MKKILLIPSLAILILAAGCEFIAPSTSKALTEKEQVRLMEQQNELLREQNSALNRIADAIEAQGI